MVLYEAVRDNLATLLEDASEVGQSQGRCAQRGGTDSLGGTDAPVLRECRMHIDIVLALHPKWAQQIESGTKRWEFRRKWPKLTPPFGVALYASAPTSAIIATATVEQVRIGTPEGLVALVSGELAAESVRDVLKYFKGCTRGAALSLTEVKALRDPLDLRTLRALGFKVPHNYTFVDKCSELARLL